MESEIKELVVNSETIMTYSEKIILAVGVLIVFGLIGWVVSALVNQLGKNSKSFRRNSVYNLVSNSIYTLIMGFGVICALGTLEVNITALVAGLGLTGFAVGMALKDAISNLVAGLMIILYEPFEIDDSIEVAGIKGKVIDMDLRYVTIQTEAEDVLIPNNNFVTSTIKKKKETEAAS